MMKQDEDHARTSTAVDPDIRAAVASQMQLKPHGTEKNQIQEWSSPVGCFAIVGEFGVVSVFPLLPSGFQPGRAGLRRLFWNSATGRNSHRNLRNLVGGSRRGLRSKYWRCGNVLPC